MPMVEKLSRGSWALARALSKAIDLEKWRRDHIKAQKGVLAKDKVLFEPLTTIVAEKASYVIFKEKMLHFTTTI